MQPPLAQVLMLTALWSGFYALHSVLALESVKNKISSLYPPLLSYYRIFYNIFSVATIIPALYFYRYTQSPVWLPPTGFTLYLAYSLMISGMMILILSFRNYKIREFIGFSYLDSSNQPQGELVIKGLNAWVRHPLYFGIILFMMGYLMYQPSLKSLLVSIITLAYLLIGIHLEEQKLKNQFGEAYLSYCKRVKKLIPFLF